MRFACWITKTTDTRLEYVILIAFPRRLWLRERAWILTFIRTLPVLWIWKWSVGFWARGTLWTNSATVSVWGRTVRNWFMWRLLITSWPLLVVVYWCECDRSTFLSGSQCASPLGDWRAGPCVLWRHFTLVWRNGGILTTVCVTCRCLSEVVILPSHDAHRFQYHTKKASPSPTAETNVFDAHPCPCLS
jgi:hypothetical protein